jgi:hypothetical protein
MGPPSCRLKAKDCGVATSVGKTRMGSPSKLHPVVALDVWVVSRRCVDPAPIAEDVLGLLAVVHPLPVELRVPLLEGP